MFYFWVFLLPWQTRYFWPGTLNNGYWEYGTYSLFVTDLLFLAWAIPTLVAAWRQRASKSEIKKDILENKWIFVAAAFLILGSLVSWPGALDKNLHLYYFGRMLAGFSLVVLLPLLKPSGEKLLAALTDSAVIQSIFALTQFFLQLSLPSKWLGLALHNPGDPGTSVVEVGIERWLRAYGSFPHPNILGGFLAVSLLALLVWYWHLYAAEKVSVKEVVYVFLSYMIVFAGLVVSFSRGAWLGFGVGALLILLSVLRSKGENKKYGLQSFLKLMGASVLIGLFFFITLTPLFTGRVVGDSRLEKKSLDERLVYQNQAVQLLKKNWLTGVGLGNFTAAVHDKLVPVLPAYLYQPVHNIYLLTWTEIGVSALVFWLCLMVWLILIIWKQPSISVINSVWPAALVCLMITGIFDHYLLSLPIGIWLFWLTLASAKNYAKVV